MGASECLDEPTYGLVPLAHFEQLADAQEHALVVLAMNLDCLITVDEAGFLIHGEEAFSAAILEEFRLYGEEQQMRAEPSLVPFFGSGVEYALVWIGLLLYCFARQLQDPLLEARFVNSAQAVIRDGEFYRPFTALFLHADLEHLMGNAVFGLVFGVFVAHSFGPFRGWALILLSAYLGNSLNA